MFAAVSGEHRARDADDVEGVQCDRPKIEPPAPAIDSSWIAVTSPCDFAFHAPPDIVEKKLQGTDSCIVAYDAAGCSYGADYGAFSGSFNELGDQPGYVTMDTVIDGHNAVLVTYGPIESPKPYVAGAHFPSLPAGPGARLTFVASCDSAQAQDVALRVFRTLTF